MAILEDTAWVTLSSKNVSYFENLSYEIPRKYNGHKMVVPRGTMIEVKIEDLLKTSIAKVTRICDYCGNQKRITYKTIIQCRENTIGNKDCCVSCIGLKSSESRNVPEGNSLADKFPHLISEWHYILNDKTPDEVSFGSSVDKYWWICPVNNEHIYDMEVAKRTSSNKSGCPYCAGVRVNHTNCLNTTHPEVSKEWNWDKNGDLTPFMFSNGSTKKVWWLCSTCGHDWYTKINSRTNKGTLSGCPECGKRIMSEQIKGEKHYNWQGGITSIQRYLRQKLTQWRLDSLKNCQYKCVITGTKGTLEIHHLYGFEMIIREMFEETGIDIKTNISDYSDEELKILEEKCLEIHYRNSMGVALRKDIHKLFHQIYGRGENTPAQFEEFKLRFQIDELNDSLNIAQSQEAS